MASADEAITEDSQTQGEPGPLQKIIDNFNNLTQKQKMAGAAALAITIALIVGTILWSRQPDYSVLFSNLSEKDGGAIVAALQQQNVPYKFSDNGNAILVQSQMVHDLRFKLAAQGLPQGGLVGFELLETQKLGVSQFHEQLNYQRGLEGELARTIQALSSVKAARVHLAIPKQTAFLRDEQKPTASILVTLHPGRVLETIQLAGIVHLVSSSVPQLNPNNVSIIDQNGNLLTKKPDADQTGLDGTQLKYIHQLEADYLKRIESILTPVVGSGNFGTQVNVDVDFDQTEQTSETYRPNPSPEQAIRSQQTNESITSESGPQGVPGALSNQPPVPATAPITTPSVAGSSSGSTSPKNATKTATVNFEVDKTVQHVKRSLGQVKRLSVAVVVNQKIEKTPKGETKAVPLTDEELKRINDLVKDAVGLNKDRGDSLSVVSSPFTEPTKPEEIPFWKNPDNYPLFKDIARWIAIGVGFALIYLLVLKPLIQQVMPPPPEPEPVDTAGLAGAEEEEEIFYEEGERPPTYEERLDWVRQLAKTNPKLVANLIKEWVNPNE